MGKRRKSTLSSEFGDLGRSIKYELTHPGQKKNSTKESRRISKMGTRAITRLVARGRKSILGPAFALPSAVLKLDSDLTRSAKLKKYTFKQNYGKDLKEIANQIPGFNQVYGKVKQGVDVIQQIKKSVSQIAPKKSTKVMPKKGKLSKR